MTEIEDVLYYLDKKHMQYKLADGANGKEALVRICPYCKDTGYHFYFNIPNKVYYCHKCQASGSLFSLKAELGDVASIQKVFSVEEESQELSQEDTNIVELAHSRLYEDEEALAYVKGRGFTDGAVEYFKLGVGYEDGAKWLWMPYIDAVGNILNVKKRRMDKKEFKRFTGRDSTLFNERALQLPTDHIVICEGETDAISLWGSGMTNVVGVPTGAKGFNSKWAQQLDKYQRIYLAYDQDQAGYEGMHGVASRLGQERCYIVKLPPDVNDVNDYIKQGHTAFNFKILMDNAKIIGVQYVNTLAGELEKYINSLWVHKSRESNTLVIPWSNLHRITNGFEPGDLIVLAARPGVGKTEMALNFLYKYSMSGIPTLLFSLEMRVERLLPKLVAMNLKKDSKLVNTFDHMQHAYEQLKTLPLYLAYVYKKPNFEFVADTIRLCVRRYGIRFVVFDNLHFLVRSANDQVREVSIIVQGFKLLAEELGIPILVIARPRKNTQHIITNIDLKDSADIEADADIVVLLHREYKNREDAKRNETGIYTTEGIFDPKCLVRVSKCRYAAGGDVYLNFQDEICTISELGE